MCVRGTYAQGWACLQSSILFIILFYIAIPRFNDDVRVSAQAARGIDGFFLYQHEIEPLLDGSLQSSWQQQLAQATSGHGADKKDIERIAWGMQHFNELQAACVWHHRLVTTGLRASYPDYPFLPHYFTLWQLAPHKGNGVSVALIDTGVAAFMLQEHKETIKHASVSMPSYMWPCNYTIVGPSGTVNPLYHLMAILHEHSDSSRYVAHMVEQELSQAIVQYLDSDDSTLLRKVCASVMRSELLTQQGELSDAGNALVHQLINGPYGITPQGNKVASPFTVGTLTAPTAQRVLVHSLPMPAGVPASYIAGHGTHAFGQITSIAPNAVVYMIKAFDDAGVTKKSHLITALAKAHACRADIVNLSLKIADTLDRTDPSTQLLESTLEQIPYVVCASGNDGDPARAVHKNASISYPARFDAVHWTVGSFEGNDSSYTISPFSQYEPEKGPLFVAPGTHILSSALVPGNTDDATYVFMTGTSMAAPQLSAFLALVLGEFGTVFSQEQIQEMCHRAGVFLHETPEWKKKSCYGVLDMRMALFMMHVAQRLKEAMVFDTQVTPEFIQYIDTICQVLYEPTIQYSRNELNGISLQAAMIDYITAAHSHTQKYRAENFFPFLLSGTLEESVMYCTKKVMSLFRSKTCV